MGNQIQKMGSKVGSAIVACDNYYKNYYKQGLVSGNLNENIQKIDELNKMLMQNIVNLGAKFVLSSQSLVKNGIRWENALVKGSIWKYKYSEEISAELDQNHSLSSQQLPKQNKKAFIDNNSLIKINLTLKQIYELHKLLSSYTQQEMEQSKKRRQSQGELCTICLDNLPEQALPCAHKYCQKCIETYILSKDRKCPMCRVSFNEGLQKSVYHIVEQDEDFVAEMKEVFYGILSESNNDFKGWTT